MWEGSDDSGKPPKLYSPPYWLNAWWTAILIPWGSSIQNSQESILTGTVNQHQEAHMPAMVILWRFAVVQTWMVEHYRGRWHPHWNLKLKSKQCIRHKYKETSGRLNCEKGKIPEKDPWHNWYTLRGILDWCFCCDTVARPTTLLNMSLRISGGGRTTSCWHEAAASSTEGMSNSNSHNCGHCEHTTITGRVVIFAVTWDIIKNSLQRKIDTIEKFLWLRK